MSRPVVPRPGGDTRPLVAAVTRRPITPPGNVVISAAGATQPGWAPLVPVDVHAGTRRARSREESERLVAEAKAADAKLNRDADAAAMAGAWIDVHEIRWAPVRWLVAAADANPAAPCWPISCWLDGLLGPGRCISPTPEEYVTAAQLSHVFGYWRSTWVIIEQMCAERVNPTPNPRWAHRSPFKSPETAWSAQFSTGADPLDHGLFAALIELMTAPDLTARVVDNRLVGDSPITKLAGLIIGPGAAERIFSGAPRDQRLLGYGGDSPLERAAGQLRGGAPEPPDRSVLDQLSPEQRRALATLVES